ncbi:serine hydrolase [Microbacterium wangchenii]|uniref:serine hydrolase n=1 Tax=Microbacterium wangchenii TaxID=2541726 RepID=UPI00164F09CA|nr:serine hydrolase [Microbacterium wangchenii]
MRKSKIRLRGWGAISAATMAAALAIAPASAASAAPGDVEDTIAAALDARDIPGAQVVHRVGTTTESYTFGVQSTATGVPVAEDTLFQAASLSKVVGAYEFLKRVDAGQIDLDTPLWDYYPSPRIADNAAAQTVTARMVLNHTTGFPNWAGAVNSETTLLVPGTTPGTSFSYSGDGFFLLQSVIEHLDGRPFDQILHDEVFVPFGMTNTTLSYRAADAPRTIVGHDASGTPGAMSTYVRGNTAYTLQTTGLDYTTFLQRAVINGEGLSPALHAEWLAPSSDAVRDAANPANPFIDWGLGIGLEDSELGQGVWHWGDNGSRKAFFLAFPDRDESVVMFWNSSEGQRSAGDILRAFYGDITFNALTWVGGYDATPAPSVPVSPGWPELEAAITPIIDEATAAGVDLGVAIEDLSGYYDGRSLFAGKQDRSTTASTIKMALAVTVMQQVEDGMLTLDDIRTILPEERYEGSGVLKDGPFPQDVSIGRMLDLMITVSDNTATNKLVDVVGGFGPINATIEAAGIPRTDLHFGRKMFGGIVPPDGDLWLTPSGMNELLTRIYEAANTSPTVRATPFLSAASAEHIIDLMLAQQVKTKLGATVPAGVLAHKTGENAEVSHDVGLVLIPGQEITLSVFSTVRPGFTGDVQAVANPFLQRIGTAVHDYLLATAPAAGTPTTPGTPPTPATPVTPGAPLAPGDPAGIAAGSGDPRNAGGALANSGRDGSVDQLAFTAGIAMLAMMAGAAAVLRARRRRARV